MLRTPKERFLATTLSGNWGKIVQSEAAEEAMRSALEQLATDLPAECPIPQQACDAYQQLLGARKVLDILSSLHVPPTITQQIHKSALNYEAGI